MPKMKDPHRSTCQQLEWLGAERLSKDRRGVEYVLPNGYRMFVDRGISRAGGAQTVRDARAHLGTPIAEQREEKRARRERKHAPMPKPTRRVDLQRVRASAHANERMALMREQEGRLDYREVAEALTRPELLEWSPEHNSWSYTRGRVTVVAGIGGDGITTIITLLWTSRELWDQNPRPEERAAARS